MRKYYYKKLPVQMITISGEARDDFGNMIMTPTIESTMGMYPIKQSYKYEAEAGATNIYDEEVSGIIMINGGEYWIHSGSVDHVHNDDYLEFAVVDKNNVTGIFDLTCAECGYVRSIAQMYDPCPTCSSQNRLQVGSGIVEMCKFVRKEYVDFGDPKTGLHNQCYEGIKGTNAVTDGMFMRTIYVSHGTENIKFKVRIYDYEGPGTRGIV